MPQPTYSGPPPAPPGTGAGRALWIAWCICWALFWLLVGWTFAPILNLVLAVLSLFAIAIGRPREVVVYPPRGQWEPPPVVVTTAEHLAWHQRVGMAYPSPLCSACSPAPWQQRQALPAPTTPKGGEQHGSWSHGDLPR